MGIRVHRFHLSVLKNGYLGGFFNPLGVVLKKCDMKEGWTGGVLVGTRLHLFKPLASMDTRVRLRPPYGKKKDYITTYSNGKRNLFKR